MRDVESYVGHVRALTEERDAIASEYERENEQLRLELARLQLLQEAQLKEVEELLQQEGLSQIAHSAASEQVAYLLVERTALLGKLGLLHSTTEGIQFCRKELEREPAGDLDDAPQRLMGAQEELQGMTEELDAPSKEQSAAVPEPVVQNSSGEQQTGVEQLKEEICEYQRSERPGQPLPEEPGAASLQGTRDEGRAEDEHGAGRAWSSLDQEDRDQGGETLHKRCREAMENMEGRNSQLLHKLQKLEQEHEDLVERNEELESILGETQIQTKQEKEQFESEVEGLQQKITSLETELLEVQKNRSEMDRKEQVASGAQEMQEMLESCQETIDKLGNHLGEQRERRRQLISELELLREDLKAEKGVLGSQGFPDSQLELPGHSNTSPGLQRASASRDLVDVSHEKHKDSALLDPEASEILQDEQSHREEQTQEDGDAKTYEEQMAKVVFLEEQIKSLREEQELLCSELLESNKKKEELEKQLKESNEEKRMLLEEISQLKHNIRSAREQGDAGETWRMSPGLEQRESRFLPWQSSAGSLDGSLKQALSEERSQQQEEKLQQLRQDLRRVQNLCSSAERELRYEREKNAELQKQNLLLQQECTKVKAELKQARAKLSDSTETCSSLSAQWERSQQKVRELEQKLSKCSQADKLHSSLRDRLAQEKSRAGEAQKKISKLQQKLKDSHHQLLLAEARVSDKKLLEEELKEARENEARVQRELHEGQLKRKLLEQQVEELRQQLRHSRETEASLAKMHVELQAKTLHALEDERKLDPGEHLQCQKENQKLSEQLSLLKEENKALYEEGVRLLNQKDLYVRGKLLEEENRLQLPGHAPPSQRVPRSSPAPTPEFRPKGEIPDWYLCGSGADGENSQWSWGGLGKPGYVGIQDLTCTSSFQSLSSFFQDSKTLHVSERQLQSKVVPPPRASFPPRDLPDPFGAMKTPQDMKPEGEAESQDSSLGLSPSQPSELGYLNVASPGDTTASPLQEESRSVGSETF
ncbi:coiled-coil domain-containing protein 30 [Manacus vitellinus]|uniref:coiled-coil domain-containing protein 30 n=1 Tax=Manacus vitellinus TaxID=328815 RepID=UPI00115F3446|nr:coiled-coil domain-containing protein 30 [Manacus vitellinus]